MNKTYWIDRQRVGRKVTGYQVTDGIWHSNVYATLKEARARLQKVLWGETVNTI